MPSRDNRSNTSSRRLRPDAPPHARKPSPRKPKRNDFTVCRASLSSSSSAICCLFLLQLSFRDCDLFLKGLVRRQHLVGVVEGKALALFCCPFQVSDPCERQQDVGILTAHVPSMAPLVADVSLSSIAAALTKPCAIN